MFITYSSKSRDAIMMMTILCDYSRSVPESSAPNSLTSNQAYLSIALSVCLSVRLSRFLYLTSNYLGTDFGALHTHGHNKKVKITHTR